MPEKFKLTINPTQESRPFRLVPTRGLSNSEKAREEYCNKVANRRKGDERENGDRRNKREVITAFCKESGEVRYGGTAPNPQFNTSGKERRIGRSAVRHMLDEHFKDQGTRDQSWVYSPEHESDDQCFFCNGAGYDEYRFAECRRCKGTGVDHDVYGRANTRSAETGLTMIMPDLTEERLAKLIYKIGRIFDELCPGGRVREPWDTPGQLIDHIAEVIAETEIFDKDEVFDALNPYIAADWFWDSFQTLPTNYEDLYGWEWYPEPSPSDYAEGKAQAANAKGENVDFERLMKQTPGRNR